MGTTVVGIYYNPKGGTFMNDGRACPLHDRDPVHFGRFFTIVPVGFC